MEKFIIVNQVPNYLCWDILSAISRMRPDLNLEIWHGHTSDATFPVPEIVVKRSGPKYDASNLISRFLSWMRFTLWVSKQIQQQDNASVLFFSNPPTVVFLNPARTLRFDYAIYDLYPDALRRLRVARVLKPITAVWKRQNARFFRHARRIIVVGEKMASQVRAYLPPAAHSKVQVVSLWAEQSIRPEGKNLIADLKKKWGIESEKVILYAGNVGASQPAEAFPRIARELARLRDWMLVIVGSGSHARLVHMRTRPFANVTFRPAVPREELSRLLSIADWGLVLLSEEAAGTSVPSKTYNLMAAGVPLLAMVPEETETARLIDENKVGFRFSWHDLPRVLNKVTSMSRSDHAAFSQRALETSKRYSAALAEEFAPPLLDDEV